MKTREQLENENKMLKSVLHEINSTLVEVCDEADKTLRHLSKEANRSYYAHVNNRWSVDEAYLNNIACPAWGARGKIIVGYYLFPILRKVFKKEMNYQTKHEDLEAAKNAALKASKSLKKTIFVIESMGKFYADESDFVRNWETLRCAYRNGEMHTK